MRHDAAPTHGTPENPGAERLLRLLALLAILAAGALAIIAAIFPHELSYVEGYLLEQGARLAGGDGLYRPFGDPAWIVDNFPPLYPALVALTVLVFGPSFTPGRILTLLAVAGLGVLLYRWLRREGTHTALAWGTLALFVVSPWVLRRGVLLRMDFAGILLAALAVYLALKWLEKRPAAALLCAALLFIAAWSTRQTLLAAPAALVLALFIHGHRRHAIVLAVAATAGAGLLIIGLTLATHGSFLQHIVGHNLGEWSLASFLRRSTMTLLLQMPILVLGTLGAVTRFRERTLPGTTLALWYLLAVLSTLSTGKPGSDYNHHLEALFVAALLTPTGLQTAHRALRGIRHRYTNRPTATPAALLALILMVQLVVTGATIPLHSSIQSLATGDEQSRLHQVLLETDGPVLSERAGPLVLAGKQVHWEPRTSLELHRAGAWDDAPLVASLENADWQLVITENFTRFNRCSEGCRWTDEAWQALESNYRRSEELGRWTVWRPE